METKERNVKRTQLRLLVLALLGCIGGIFSAIATAKGSLLALVIGCICVVVVAVAMQAHDILSEREGKSIYEE